jgi:hypothetical protein
MNTEALESFAAGRKLKTKAEWAPPTREDFPVGPFWARQVIAVDQSLRKFAAVFMINGLMLGSPQISVLAAKKFSTEEGDVSGWEANFQRAMQLAEEFKGWVLEVSPGFHLARTEIVHEAPPAGGGRIIRPEASILGGMAVRVAARDLRLPTQRLVTPQTHKRFVCGTEKVTKAQHHAKLKELAGELGVTGMDLIKNQDQRDAFSIGLVQLSRPVPGEA